MVEGVRNPEAADLNGRSVDQQLRDALAKIDRLEAELAEVQRRPAVEQQVEMPRCLDLTKSERGLLTLLYNRSPSTVAKDDIMDRLYPDGWRATTKIIDVFVSRMRQKLQPFNLEIGTQWGVGCFLSRESCAALKALIDREFAMPPAAPPRPFYMGSEA